MKNVTNIMAFKLSVLTTLMLCVTANNNASDIEIYKAPNAADGKARVMLNLDNSSFMSPPPSGAQSPGSIYEDFGNGMTCPNGSNNYYTQSVTRVFNGISYTDNEYYCTTPAPVSNASNLNKAAIEARCEPVYTDAVLTSYKCFDRYTMVRRSLYAVVNSNELGDKVSLGLGLFPLYGTTQNQRPVPLGWYKVDPSDSRKLINCPAGTVDNSTGCTYGRDILNARIHNIAPSVNNPNDSKIVPVAKAYGVAAKTLLTNENGGDLTADQCSGYGIFTLTAGVPVHEEMDVAQSNINSVMQSGFQITSTDCPTTGSLADGRAWKCVGKAADLLAAGKAKIAMPVKSVVVSFGTGFDFSQHLSDYDPRLTTAQMIQRVTDEIAATATNSEKELFNNKGAAAISGVKGGGGYYSAKDSNALTDTIKRFIADVARSDIPFMTTGAPTIPQDPLNPVLVQSNAYFAQFKPTPLQNPSDGSQLWAGNMKKYHVNNLGRLIGKNTVVIGAAEEKEAVTDELGRLITGTHDYWAPDVSSEDSIAKGAENIWGSELYARMGGVWSQLPLSTSVVESVTVENRKLLTNRVVDSSTGAASNGSSLRRINRADWAANDQKRSDIMSLLDLRQLGAVMHSSPLLLSNQGRMTYNATTNKIESSNREDYVLFGSVQGILHVVKADDYTATNGGGKEVFAFVPNEMVERQSKAFLTPDQSTNGTANLFYGIDAPWVAYTEYVPKADGTLTVGTGKVTTGTATLQGKQMVYGGLRMGGRSYYALDLKNMNDPRLKFHINPDAATTGPLSYMGESWSKPKLAWINWQGSRKLVMFVGGGYDAGGTNGIGSKANNAGYESDIYDQTNGIGAGVYMFSADGADAGDLLWWVSSNATATTGADVNSGVIALKDANIKYSVVSEIKTADRDNDGLVDHLYFGDLGGQLFRIDLNNNAATSGAFATRSTRIMNMHASGGKSPRFYAAPSFAIFEDRASGNLFAAISIGSGNVSHPLAGYDSGRNPDALYTVYDKDVTRSDLYTASVMNTQDTSVGNTNTNLAINEVAMVNRFQQTASAMATPIAPYGSSAGWYYKLPGGTKIQHEKIFFSPTVIDYDLYVSSYDSSRLGLTGECGGGVQGVSKVQIFCMPFGQCSAADYPSRTSTNYSDEHGPGIQNHTTANPGDGTTRLIGGTIIGNNLNDTYATKVKLIAQRWYER